MDKFESLKIVQNLKTLVVKKYNYVSTNTRSLRKMIIFLMDNFAQRLEVLSITAFEYVYVTRMDNVDANFRNQ